MTLFVSSENDVVAVGGGTAGLAAAVAASRNGVDTLLIERYGFLGGATTAGLVNPFMTFHAGEEQIIEGIFQEIIDRLENMNGYDRKNRAYDAEVMKIVADQMVEEAGVKLMLHSLVVDAVMEGNFIRGVLVENKSGRQRVMAKVVVDATGDGDVAVKAGAPYEKGRRIDGLTQPMTLNFRMGGVDTAKMPNRSELNKLYDEAKARGEISIPRENLLWFPTVRRGEIHFNTTRVVKVDGTSGKDLTYSEVEARRQMIGLVEFLKRKVPGFESAFLLVSGSQIGVRETRRVMGKYVMTEEDVLGARKFEDVVARGSYPIDIHSPKGEGTVIKRLPPGASYDIPYRCLVPKGVENLLVAGRCVSCTHEAQAAIRVIPICMAMGQAAGTAAALAVKLKVTPGEMDVTLLQKTLREQGANLG